MGDEHAARHRRAVRPASPCAGARVATDALAERFSRRVVTIAPGGSHAYVSGDWADTLVVVEDGTVELEDLGGGRHHLGRGAVLWLADLPLRALHNVGRHPAVLVAVRRRIPRDDGAT